MNKKRNRDRMRESRLYIGELGDPMPPISKELADKVVRLAAGRRPDLPSGKDYVDEVRHEKAVSTPYQSKDKQPKVYDQWADTSGNTQEPTRLPIGYDADGNPMYEG